MEAYDLIDVLCVCWLGFFGGLVTGWVAALTRSRR